MAIDLSNLGPGSATAQDISRKRRERLAAAKARPVTGPGASGLGIGANLGIQRTPSTVFTNNPANTIPASSGTWVDRKFANVDTMLFKDRLAPVRAFYESNWKDFNLKPNGVKSMIRAGFISYGKGGNMKYPGLTASANPQALNELLRTNYVQKGNKWIRVNKDLQATPNTLSYLAYGGVS